MHIRLAPLLAILNLPSPTPTPESTPTLHPSISSNVSGSGLTSVLLVLVILALLGVICGVLWMFITGRWQVATHPQAQKNSYPPQRTGAPPTFSSAPPSLDARYQETHLIPPNTPRREDPLNNKRWLDLATNCVDLFDELDGLFPPSDPQYETAKHIQDRLQEILKRSGVEMISRDRTYDEDRHQLEHPGLEVVPGTPIVKIVSPGFAVGRLVLRPARVRVQS